MSEAMGTELAHVGSGFNPLAALQAAIQGGVTPENVATVRELMQLAREFRQDQARESFDEALAALQTECRAVKVNRLIPGKRDGEVRSAFADYSAIMAEVQPLLDRHGFSVSYDAEYLKDPLRIEVSCRLSRQGHDRVTKFSARVSAPPGCSDAQADGSTNSYAKRYALCNALNIVIDRDDDARSLGGPITEDEAADLERRVRECYGGDEAQIGRFLRFVGADSFADIPRNRYDAANSHLATATAAKPCPEADDPNGWREAMACEMSARWQVNLGDADKALARAIKGQEMTPDRRRAAWHALVTGRMDSFRPEGK